MTSDELDQLEECLGAEEGLTPWEIDFIESMEKKRGRELTPGQSECLMKIASGL